MASDDFGSGPDRCYAETMPGKIPTKRKARRPQADDLETVARRLGCDEDKDRFEEKLGKIAAPKKRRTKASRV